jgi:hypothetical protein
MNSLPYFISRQEQEAPQEAIEMVEGLCDGDGHLAWAAWRSGGSG